ncbi:MAG: peptidoglycan-binding protein, partial [Cyanobacteria bacterium J06555_12]
AALVRGELLAALRDEMEVKKVVLGDPRTALLLKTAIFTDTQDLIAAMVAWNKPQLRSYVNHYLQLNEPVSSADDLIERYPTVFTPAEDS